MVIRGACPVALLLIGLITSISHAGASFNLSNGTSQSHGPFSFAVSSIGSGGPGMSTTDPVFSGGANGPVYKRDYDEILQRFRNFNSVGGMAGGGGNRGGRAGRSQSGGNYFIVGGGDATSNGNPLNGCCVCVCLPGDANSGNGDGSNGGDNGNGDSGLPGENGAPGSSGEPSVVPEPGTFAVWSLAGLMLIATTRRRKA